MNSPGISERDCVTASAQRQEVFTAFLFLLPLLVGIILFFIVPIVETSTILSPDGRESVQRSGSA